ncbi:MAG: tetratricopeptide repeat protein [Balneolales bacterium]|nr:tetratricopeptide repeat protein [Balneolales bacterium]
MNLRIAKYLLLIIFIAASPKEDTKKGNEAYEEGNYELAESHFRAAIDADPEFAIAHFNLGNALAKQGKIEEAIQHYMEYSSLSETMEEKALAEYNIGTLLSETEQWKPAVQHFKNSLKYNPTDLETVHNFERALNESNKQEDEQQQEQGENEPPPPPTEYAKAMRQRAEQLVSERRYKEAFDLMQQALQLDESVQNYNDFINRIGEVYEIDS